MSGFKINDEVEVTNPISAVFGARGVVKNIEHGVVIILNGDIEPLWFSEYEVKLVKDLT